MEGLPSGAQVVFAVGSHPSVEFLGEQEAELGAVQPRPHPGLEARGRPTHSRIGLQPGRCARDVGSGVGPDIRSILRHPEFVMFEVSTRPSPGACTAD